MESTVAGQVDLAEVVLLFPQRSEDRRTVDRIDGTARDRRSHFRHVAAQERVGGEFEADRRRDRRFAPVARGFVERGFARKQQLIDWLAENAQVTAREYWDDPWTQTLVKPHAVAGVEPWASVLKAEPDAMVRKYRAQDISVVVLGGETQSAWKMRPQSSYS